MSASDPPSSAPNPADASAEPWLASARISQSERRLRRWFVEWRVRTALSGDETNEPQHVRFIVVVLKPAVLTGEQHQRTVISYSAGVMDEVIYGDGVTVIG